MSDSKYSTLNKADLLAALLERDQELAEVQQIADSALARLTLSEQNKFSGRKEEVIDTEKHGRFLFIGNGFRTKAHGIVTAQKGKEKPEILAELAKGGCEFVKKF